MPRKSGRETKIEQVTWLALVALFIFYSLGDNVNYIPEYVMPFGVGLILLASGIYQYRHGYRVGPIVWILAGVMLLVGGYSFYTISRGGTLIFSTSAVAFFAVVAVISFGVFTKES